jgi:hypothetical protein
MSGWAAHVAASPAKSTCVSMGMACRCRSWSQPGTVATRLRSGQYSMPSVSPVADEAALDKGHRPCA